MKDLFILPGEGTPIHSMPEDILFLHGNECDASTHHIVLAGRDSKFVIFGNCALFGNKFV